jgi:flavin reductase (DIM6/NTAB) family NADH-FMN oxidoreductase RutF
LKKDELPLSDVLKCTYEKLDDGVLLVSAGSDGRKNIMTIGWGLVGVLWREPVFMVAVRDSRYTHELMEETNEFTVNIPGDDMGEAIELSGGVSGRDQDKFKETGLTAVAGKNVQAPIISECLLHFECKVIGKTQLSPGKLSGEVLQGCYPRDDYHTLYYGKILSVYGERC